VHNAAAVRLVRRSSDVSSALFQLRPDSMIVHADRGSPHQRTGQDQRAAAADPVEAGVGEPDPRPKEDAYAVFCGAIEHQTLIGFFPQLLATTNPDRHIGHLHLAFQSTGGTVGDCISLYNLFRAFTVDLTLYNIGALQSGAVTAYLGAPHRKISPHAHLMIHPCHCSAQFDTLSVLESTANSVRLDDARTEAIIRAHTRLPERLWATSKEAAVFLSAAEAVEYGFADEIAEFCPRPGAQVYSW
jgi:ATP-dependent Clp protease protease subunit